MRPIHRLILIGATVLVASASVSAHPGHMVSSPSQQGATHPFTGLDHLVVILALGLLASLQERLWAWPLAFLAGMTAGGFTAAYQAFPIGLIEQGVAASVLVVGTLLVLSRAMPVAAGITLVSAFAFLHGQAHLAEATGTQPVAYGIGMLATTAALLTLGVLIGCWARRPSIRPAWRVAGAATAVAGGTLLLLHAV